MVKVVSVSQMRDLEQAAYRDGLTEGQLQETAGTGVARVVAQLCPLPATGVVVVVAGPGNNGRDGWVAARRLAERGYGIRLYLAPRHGMQASELEMLARLGGKALVHTGAESLLTLRHWLESAGAAVDAVLGIGARGPVRAPLDGMVAALRDAREARGSCLPVIAVDVPSGVNADTGAVEGTAVKADVTVCFGAAKAGLLRFPGAALAGDIAFVEIGIPTEVYSSCSLDVMTDQLVAPLLPTRPLDAHKGTFGRVLVVGGSQRYIGAVYLAAAAAARVGAGLVAVAATPRLQSIIAPMLPEATYVPLPEGGPSIHPQECLEAVVDALADCRALLVGPGLGREEAVVQWVLRLMEAGRSSPGLRCVVDADALFALSLQEGCWKLIPESSILTPHYGEMGRLLGTPPEEVAADPQSVASEAASRWGHVVALKGAITWVLDPSGRGAVYPRPNPALATGGTGDVLAGLMAGLLSQGLGPWEAATAGVYLHAMAAREVLDSQAWDLLLASDLLPAIPTVMAKLRRM